MYRNEVTSMLKCSKRLNMNKQFWKLVKYLNKKRVKFPPSQMIRVQHPTTSEDNKSTASDNFQKAEMLNQFFSKCYNHSVPEDDSDRTFQITLIQYK